MEIQLIRNRLVEELVNLPDVATPEIQSYALTSAVLVRRITEALNITDLRIQDAWRRETAHDLAYVLRQDCALPGLQQGFRPVNLKVSDLGTTTSI